MVSPPGPRSIAIALCMSVSTGLSVVTAAWLYRINCTVSASSFAFVFKLYEPDFRFFWTIAIIKEFALL